MMEKNTGRGKKKTPRCYDEDCGDEGDDDEQVINSSE